MSFFNIIAGSSIRVTTAPSIPQSSALVGVSKHIRGHVASFSESTDTIQEYSRGGELLCLKHNIGCTVFIAAQGTISDRFVKMGRLDLGWYDGSAISNLTNITASRQGREVTAIAYTGGTDNNKLDYLPSLLSGRNSEYETTPLSIEYTGLTDVDLISKASTFRYGYYTELEGRTNFIAGTNAEGLTKVYQYAQQTITEEGHYHNFMHWHWWTKDYAELYFQALENELVGQDVYSGSYGDIQEYQFVRDSVDTISYANEVVSISYSKKYPNSPYWKISTPLWVRLDLSETALSGKDITTSHAGQVRSAGADVFFVSINLDFTLTSANFTVSETLSPVYVNLNKPIVSLSGQTFTSDQPVKVNVYRKLKAEYIHEGGTVELLYNSFQTSFTLTTSFDTATYNYYIAFINQYGVSGTYEF